MPKIDQPYLYNNSGYWTFIQPEITEKYFEEYHDGLELMEDQPTKAEKIFKNVINNCGNGYLDAILHLGFLYNDTGKVIEGNALIHKAHSIALHSIPKKFNPKKDELSWSILENRPFLRAFHAIGLEYMKERQYKKALENFNFILSVNNWDNQGIRYLLPECYLHLKKYRDFVTLYNTTVGTPDEGNSIEYDYALFYALYKLKEFEKAKNQFLLAKDLFPNVALELVKAAHSFPHDEFNPPPFDGGIPIGSKQEAYTYWNQTKELWNNDKKMLEFIRQI